MNKQIDYYLSLPYTIEIIPETQGGWYVGIKELPGCMTETDSPEEGLAEIRQLQREWLEIALEDGVEIPIPRPEEQYSGNFRLRLPRSLHSKLAEEAEREGVSLNALCNAYLAEAVGYHKNAKATDQRRTAKRPRAIHRDAWAKLCQVIGTEGKSEKQYEEIVAEWLNTEFDNAYQCYLAGKPQEAVGYLFYLSKLFTDKGADDTILQSYGRLFSQMRKWIEVFSERQSTQKGSGGQSIDEIVVEVNRKVVIRKQFDSSRSEETLLADRVSSESPEVAQFSALVSKPARNR